MKLTNRFTLAALAFILLLPIIATGCIVVVEEDDDYDRRRYLHGSEWTLEVVFYRTETMQAADRSIQMQFDEQGRFSGTAECGSFSGNFALDDSGGIQVDSIEETQQCEKSGGLGLFGDGLRTAKTYQASEDKLTISTNDNGYLSFSTQ